MKNILVAVDFSPVSLRAMHYAASMAKVLKAELVLLHVNGQVRHLTATVMVAIQDQDSYAEKRLKRLCGLLKKQYGTRCSYECRTGDITSQVCSAAQEKQSLFIVMGTRGASRISEKLVGTQTTRVIRRAACPVLAVPAGARFNGLKNVLFATDYQSNDEERINAFTTVAGKFGAYLSVVHVCPAEDREPERMLLENFASQVRKQVRYRKLSFRLLTGNPESALSVYARHEGHDLLVFSADNKNWFSKVLGSRITRRMAFHTKIPFMVWRLRNE